MSSASLSLILVLWGMFFWSIAVFSLWADQEPEERRKLTRQLLFRSQISHETPAKKAWSSFQLLGEFSVLIGILLSLIAPFENVSEETVVFRCAATLLAPFIIVIISLNSKTNEP